MHKSAVRLGYGQPRPIRSASSASDAGGALPGACRVAGRSRIHLAPGEEREVSFPVEQLRMLDQGMHWVVEPGVFRMLIGSSSKDIRLRGDLVVQ